MVTAEVVFVGSSGPPTDAEEDAIISVLAAWLKNGQLSSDRWNLAHSDGQWRVFVGLPDATSLEASHANVYAVKAIEELAAHGLSIREIRVLGSDLLMGPACTCERWASLVLFTNYLSRTSPVRCGTCFDPVALYRLPFTRDEEHLDVLQWAADYRACDTLQMHCTTGERFAEEQLSKHDSSLSKNGREIARALSDLLKIPVYYYLLKSRGRTRAAELERRCPSCEVSWRLDKPWHDLFDFRCDTCCLVSNVAFSVAAGGSRRPPEK